jgi:hypothetical protein
LRIAANSFSTAFRLRSREFHTLLSGNRICPAGEHKASDASPPKTRSDCGLSDRVCAAAA